MSSSKKQLFVYGTLMPKVGSKTFGTRLVKDATVSGKLYTLGGFPGFKPGDGVVKGQLLEIDEGHLEAVLRGLDRYEGYREDQPEHSLYLRETITTNEGDECFIYTYNRPVNEDIRIPSGDWANRKTGV